MKKNFLIVFSLLFFSLTAHSQNAEMSSFTIADSLKQNANSVVRLSQLSVTVSSQSSMILKSKKITTVLNELGLNNLDLMEYYDKNKRILKIEATTYDASGKIIKVFKRKDFKDRSVADGVSIFNDNRALFLDYTPITYPFTMVFETEVETSNTAFIPSWSPIDGYLVSTENTSLTINFKPELHLKKKEINFSDKYPIEKTETAASYTYTAKNIKATKREELSPGFIEIFPMVYFSLEKFQLENVNGIAADWKDFGKWYYDSLLADTEEIPLETQTKIKQLIGNEKDPREIAKIIYKFVQEKTRYVSVQVGIGGWKPMLAKDVDKLSYGDCKALTNYTRCLLKTVGIPSYFTVVWAGNETKDIQNDIASIEGNHAILTLPTAKGNLWMECTSQISPFGFQGDFTDDRNVLVIKPEGGEIVRTKTFTESDNLKIIKGAYSITENGSLNGNVTIISKGLDYDREYGKERASKEDQIKRYKEELSNINNLILNKISFHNDPNAIVFTEDLEVKAEGYAQNSNGKLMFALNAFNQNSYVPKKYKTREFSFEIQRGYTNEDETEITIPDGFYVEAKPNGIELNTEFGSYKIEFLISGPNKITCKRKLMIKKGLFDKTNYENYRKFRESIAKNDNSKIIITKK
ncbi:DUF3857 domain-containing protein [Flavobacterium sp.]|uniref:DUF3857 domain-containing protein n=1 Tax=Flavobacterium sp. TaxID=239 RepID=UPI003D6A0738